MDSIWHKTSRFMPNISLAYQVNIFLFFFFNNVIGPLLIFDHISIFFFLSFTLLISIFDTSFNEVFSFFKYYFWIKF